MRFLFGITDGDEDEFSIIRCNSSRIWMIVDFVLVIIPYQQNLPIIASTDALRRALVL